MSIPTLDCGGTGHFIALDLPNGAGHFVCPTLGVLTTLGAAEFIRIAGARCRCGYALSSPKPGQPATQYALSSGQNQQ